MQTRYYNPQWGRFLNADGYVNANGNLIGYNMFTYCSNNPVIYLDTNGQSLSDIWNGICDFVDSFVEWLNSIKNKDGSFSLYDNDRFNDKDIWHEQFFVITPDDMQYSIANGDLSLGLAADFCTGGWEWKHFDLSLFDFGHAEGSISNNGLSGMASIWSPSIAFIFDEVRIEIGFEAGAVGIEDNIAIANNQVNIAFAYGWGISLNVSW